MGLSVIPTEAEGSLFVFAGSLDRRKQSSTSIPRHTPTHMPYNYLGG
jgi:hypothetical protein